MYPKIPVVERGVSQEMADTICRIREVLEEKGAKLFFESETLRDQGALLTLEVNGERLPIGTEAPDCFELDAQTLKQVCRKTLLVDKELASL